MKWHAGDEGPVARGAVIPRTKGAGPRGIREGDVHGKKLACDTLRKAWDHEGNPNLS